MLPNRELPLPPPDEWVEVARTRHRRELDRHLAVLEALGLPNSFEQESLDWVLRVPRRYALRARRELIEFDEEESEPPPPAPPRPVQLPTGWFGLLVYGWVLVLVDRLAAQGLFFDDWRGHGMAATEALRAGEWWRAFTALTLHADATHLVGNLVFGALFARFLAQATGTGLAFLGMLVAGALGNWLAAWVRAEPVHSLGASTAVFGGLGLLSVLSWIRRRPGLRRWPLRIAPILAGLVLLGFLGSEGERTDVVAHGMGFVAGVALAFPAHRWLPRTPRPGLQLLAGALALGLLTLSWVIAASR